MENCGTCPPDCQCPASASCEDQECITDYCQADVDVYGCCKEDLLIWCFNGLHQADCSEWGQKCGLAKEGSNLPEGYTCGYDGQIKVNENMDADHPFECPECIANCVGKECGEDGCGGSCGECAEGLVCFNGSCANGCIPDCNDKNCGDDGCLPYDETDCGGCPWENSTCDSAGSCQCLGEWCNDKCCPGGEWCFPDGQCEGGKGCVHSKLPTCGGCSCEECVCAVKPSCCNESWDGECADLCAGLCGGCDGIPTCGNSVCEPESRENCG